MRKSKLIFVAVLMLTCFGFSASIYAEEIKVRLNVPTVF